MIEPPLPGIPAILLAVAARLGFRVTSRDANGAPLGVFVDGTTDQALLLVGAGGSAVEWRIEAPTTGFASWLISRATYDVLHGGALASDGAITYGGQRYRVRAWFDGGALVAEAVVV